MIKRQLLVINAEQVENGRMKIGNGHFVPGDKISDLVRLSIVKALFHTSAMLKRGFSFDRCPVNNLYEATTFLLWTIAATYLVVGF